MNIREIGKTRIVWDDVFEEYKCEKCQNVIYYGLDFRYCPYCRRKIIQVKTRGIEVWQETLY